MGVDFLDLTLGIERVFRVKIPEKELHRMTTVGDLYDYLQTCTPRPLGGHCLTADCFTRLSKGIENIGLDCHIGPSTPLCTVFPDRNNRRNLWKKLSRTTGLRLPALVRSTTTKIYGLVLAIIASILFRWFIQEHVLTAILKHATGWLEAVTQLALFWLFFYLMTFRYQRELPEHLKTMRDLSEKTLYLNSTVFQEEDGAMGRKDIWALLQGLIVDTLGVDEDEVIPEASFVADLGCE